MAKKGFFDDLEQQLSEIRFTAQDEKRLAELKAECSRLDFTDVDKKRLSELEQEMKQFELSLLDSDLAFLLS